MGLFDFWRGKRVKLTDTGFWSEFGGGRSQAGMNVNYETVLQLGAANACARKLAESVSCLPFVMQRVGDDGSVRPDPEHNLSRVLGDQPNADQPAQQFWELVVLQLALRGNHYSLRLKLGGELVGLEPLPPHPQTYCRRTEAGAREFVVTTGARQGVYAEDEIFFIPGFGEDLDCGLSVIGMARHTFGRMMAMEQHQSRLYKNGARPSMVMTSPGVLTDEQRKQVKENIIGPFTGADNSGGVFLLEGGFQIDPVTLSPADSQMLQSWQFGVEEICRWFGVPPWLIGHTQKSSNWGTGLEEQFRAFATLSLQPYIKRILGEIRRQLMTRNERRKLRPHISLAALHEGDSKGMAEVDVMLVRGGIETSNEVRARRGRPPIEGGDVLRTQAQMVPLGGDPNGGNGNDPQN